MEHTKPPVLWVPVSFPGVKRLGRYVDNPPQSSAEVKERVELFLYSPFWPSWPVIGRTFVFLPFTFMYDLTNLTMSGFCESHFKFGLGVK